MQLCKNIVEPHLLPQSAMCLIKFVLICIPLRVFQTFGDRPSMGPGKSGVEIINLDVRPQESFALSCHQR